MWKPIQSTAIAKGRAWSSRKGWFWLSVGGEIYSFAMDFGRFGISFEKKHDRRHH